MPVPLSGPGHDKVGGDLIFVSMFKPISGRFPFLTNID